MANGTRSVALKTGAVFLALALIFAVAARPYIDRFGLKTGAVAGIYSCFLTALILALVPGVVGFRARVPVWAMPLLWCVPYLLYAAGTGDFRWVAFGKLLAAGAVVVLLYRLAPVRDGARFEWQDLVVAIWLIAVLMGHQLAGIWTVPVNLDFVGRLFLIAVAGWSWMFVREVPGLGYEWRLSWRVLGAAGWNFVLFSLIAMPVGFAVGFIQWHPLHKGVLDFGLAYLEIFLFIALLEEMFFRGFLQTLVTENLGSARLGQVVVACLFGLFHILHAPFPNWRYVLLASVAGWFYGQAFVKSGTLVGSALTHAMVDTVWRTFFSKS